MHLNGNMKRTGKQKPFNNAIGKIKEKV